MVPNAFWQNNRHAGPHKTSGMITVFFLLSLHREQPGPIRAGGRAAEGVVQSQRAHWGEEGGAVRTAETDSRKHSAGVGWTFQDHPAAPARNNGWQRGKQTQLLHSCDKAAQIGQSKLQSLKSSQHVIRTLALRVLREILSKQPWRFKNYAELTIMKALEAHKDPHKEVHVLKNTHTSSLKNVTMRTSEMAQKCLNEMIKAFSRIKACACLLRHYEMVAFANFKWIYLHQINTDDSTCDLSPIYCFLASILLMSARVPAGGTSSRGDSGHVGVVHQSRPVHQSVVSHHPVSWLSHQPGCHQDADQSGREGSPRGPDQPAAGDSARTHTGKTHTNITYLTLHFDTENSWSTEH